MAWALPMLAVGAHASIATYRARLEAERNANLELARAVATGFQNFVLDLQRQELVLGETMLRGGLSPDEARRWLAASAREYAAVRDFLWASPDGTVRISTDPRLARRSLADRAYFAALRAGRRHVVSGILSAKTDGQPIFVVARAMRGEDGALLGAVVAAVDATRLDAAVSLARVGEAAISLIDPDGRVAFSSGLLRRAADDAAAPPEPLTARALRGEEASGTVPDERDGDRIGAAVPVGDLGWVARASRMKSEVTGPVLRDVRHVAAVGLLVLLACVGGSLLVARRIVLGIVGLERQAAALGRGDPGPRPVRGLREVERLSETLDELARRLRAARRSESFLLAAGAVLTESLQFEQVVERLARLCVPGLADWCSIDEVGEDGRVRLLAMAHADPAREAWGRALRLRHPPAEGHSLAWRALSTRRTIFLPEVGPEHLADVARDPEHLEVLRARGLRSWIAVPLVARGNVYGALSLSMAESGRTFGREDVRTAEDLASRAAQALDNAALYRQQQRAVRHRDEVLSIVSHDLRNLLSPVLLGARGLQAAARAGTLGPEKLARTLERIVTAGARMGRLIGDLVDLSRLQEGRLSVVRARQHPGELVAEVVEAFRPAAEAKALALDADVPQDLPDVDCDRDRVVQVLGNLVSNAVKATERGFVRVRAEPRAGEVLFEVADSGPGIAAEDAPHIFDRFRRGAGAAYAGSGLGLAIARGLVEAHGGRIWVESTPGLGSRFLFTLPAFDARPRERGPLLTPPPASSAGDPAASGSR
jgi:signal transduction histidine kinase